VEEKKRELASIAGCISVNGKVYVPVAEVIRLCYRFSRLLGKDFASMFEKATVSPEIKDVSSSDAVQGISEKST
jgi:hypothetical protein